MIDDWKLSGISYEEFTKTVVMDRDAHIIADWVVQEEIEAGRYKMGDKYE